MISSKLPLLAFMFAGAVSTTAAQSQAQNARPSFDAASIKPSEPPKPMGGGNVMIRMGCNGGPGQGDPVRFSCENMSLTQLIIAAYGIKTYQLKAPSWMDSVRFDITATIPQGTTPEQFHLMEQDLLAKRFGLVLHREPKEMDAYELGVGKGGPKFKESPKTDDALQGASAAPAMPPPGAMGAPPRPDTLKTGPDGLPILPPGTNMPAGAMRMMVSNGRMVMATNRETMDQFTDFLSRQLTLPVIDATGLKGEYDLTLSFSPEGLQRLQSLKDMGGPPPPDAGRGDSGAATTDAIDAPPTLQVAVQEQLGLKLDRKKTNVDLFVVDRCETSPTAN